MKKEVEAFAREAAKWPMERVEAAQWRAPDAQQCWLWGITPQEFWDALAVARPAQMGGVDVTRVRTSAMTESPKAWAARPRPARGATGYS